MTKPLDAAKSRSFEGGPSFGLGNRFYRMLWNLTWMLLASWTHPLHGWRRFLLRIFGAKIGRGVYISPSARIWFPRNIDFDDYVAIGDEVDLYSMDTIRVGKYGIISKGAHICAGSHDINDAYFQLLIRPISIGDYAWIAADTFVGPGVTVAEGAVLGARGVAMRDLRPWTVYAGNPAREISKRTQNRRVDAPKRGWLKSFEKRSAHD